MLSVLLLLSAQVSTEPVVRARGDLRTLFTADDYPVPSHLLGQEGDVQAGITVGTDGRVTACLIIVSSGFATLDRATCDIIRQRARFTPARDANGKATIDHLTTPPVRWSLQDNEYPFASWTTRLLVALDKRGAPTNCALQLGGALGGRDQWVVECADLKDAFAVPKGLTERFAGKETVLIYDQQFIPRVVDAITVPKDLKDYALVSRDLLSFRIDSEGKVSGCARLRHEGEYRAPTDGCETINGRRFQALGERAKVPVPVTSTTSIYAYSR